MSSRISSKATGDCWPSTSRTKCWLRSIRAKPRWSPAHLRHAVRKQKALACAADARGFQGGQRLGGGIRGGLERVPEVGKTDFTITADGKFDLNGVAAGASGCNLLTFKWPVAIHRILSAISSPKSPCSPAGGFSFWVFKSLRVLINLSLRHAERHPGFAPPGDGMFHL